MKYKSKHDAKKWSMETFGRGGLIGTIPNAGNRYFVLWLSMYSALPRNTTGRGDIVITSGESKNERWLGLRIAGPSIGTFSSPLTSTRYSNRIAGRATNRAGPASEPIRGASSVPNARTLRPCNLDASFPPMS